VNAQLTIPGCDPDPREDLSQHFTPRALAERMVAWAGVDHKMHVLEPSAGSGAFVDPLLRAGARVQAVEIDQPWADRLVLRYQARPDVGSRLQVARWDFMTWDPGFAPGKRFDKCVMNSPYEDDQDLLHVCKALDLCRTVVALVRTVFLHGVGRYEKIWSRRQLTRVAHLVRRPHFSGAGSPRHDFCVVELQCTRPVFGAQSVIVEHWLL
jgi:tRNA G37 N-methylase Trm5